MRARGDCQGGIIARIGDRQRHRGMSRPAGTKRGGDNPDRIGLKGLNQHLHRGEVHQHRGDPGPHRDAGAGVVSAGPKSASCRDSRFAPSPRSFQTVERRFAPPGEPSIGSFRMAARPATTIPRRTDRSQTSQTSRTRESRRRSDRCFAKRRATAPHTISFQTPGWTWVRAGDDSAAIPGGR